MRRPRAGLTLSLGALSRPGYVLALLVLAVAVGGALLAGPDGGRLTLALATASARSTELLEQLGAALPFGYAFVAGMVGAVNPCGIALLPAYLALGFDASEADGRPALLAALAKALALSGSVTGGFVVLFGAAGLVLSATAALVTYLPWAGLAVGVLLTLAGGRCWPGAISTPPYRRGLGPGWSALLAARGRSAPSPTGWPSRSPRWAAPYPSSSRW